MQSEAPAAWREDRANRRPRVVAHGAPNHRPRERRAARPILARAPEWLRCDVHRHPPAQRYRPRRAETALLDCCKTDSQGLDNARVDLDAAGCAVPSRSLGRTFGTNCMSMNGDLPGLSKCWRGVHRVVPVTGAPRMATCLTGGASRRRTAWSLRSRSPRRHDECDDLGTAVHGASPEGVCAALQ